MPKAFKSAELLILIKDPVSAKRARVVALLNPVFDTFRMEEVLGMAVQSSDVLLLLEVLPADDAFFFTVVEASSEFEFADAAEHRNLVVVVLESVHIKEKVMMYDFLKYQQPIDDHKDAKETQHEHAHE